MKKITFLAFILLFGLTSYAQSICTQTFTVTGNDDDPTVLTINAADITCNGGFAITNLRLINPAGSFNSGFCSADGSSWFGFDLSIDGGPITTGCGADFDNTNITGFTSLTITSHDDDAYQDFVTMTIDVEVTYTPTSVPSCTVLSSPGNGATGINSGIISWPAVSGAAGYKLSVGTTPGGTDILNMSDVANVLTYDLGALTPGGTYYVKVTPYNVVGDAVGCTESSFTTCVVCYCDPIYTTGKIYGDLISDIQILGTTLSNNTGTSPVNPAFSYFTGMPNYTATLQAGNTYTVSVTVGSFGGQNVAVWIDYNDNGTFETSERVGYTTASIAGNGSATFQIVVACNPALGSHRMRVRDVWNTTGINIDPCLTYGYGETEDYIVTISAAVPCPQPSMLAANAITTNSASLTWNVGCAETLWNVHLTTAGGGAPVGTGSNPGVANPLAVSGLTPATTYEFYVQADCAGNGTSLWTGPFTFTTNALPPANDECATAVVLTPGGVFNTNPVVGTNNAATNSAPPAPGCAFFVGGDVWYSVTVPASGNITIETNSDAGSPITDTGLAVYSGTCGGLTLELCDDDSSLDGAFSMVSLTGRAPGEVLYVNVWEYGNDAVGTFRVSAYDASLSTGSFDMTAFKAYPNPVTNVLNLSYSSEISSVEVFNVLGQKVIAKTLNVTNGQVDMSNLNAGTYLVKVTADGLTKTIKVVKQ